MKPSLVNKLLISLIKWFHLAVLVFLLVGWLIGYLTSSPTVFWAHLAVVPLVVFHWQTNGGSCILTVWERRLRPQEAASRQKPQGEFSRGLLKAVFGVEVKDRQLFWMVYGCLAMSWALSLFFYGRL